MTYVPMPVTVVMARRAAPGRARELAAWAESLCTTASAFPGYLGHKVHEIRAGESSEVVIALTFATSSDLVVWEQSAERHDALKTGAEFTKGAPTSLASGLLDAQAWADTSIPPSPTPLWQTAAIVWAGLFPPAVLVNLVLEPYADAWPVPLRTLVLTLLLVPIVVYGTVPLVNRTLRVFHRGWSHRASPEKNAGHPH